MKQEILLKKKEINKGPLSRKDSIRLILLLGFLSALGPFSIDMYLPGFPSIASDLKTDIATVGLSLTAYFIGISAGQLFYGPIIDRFGRKKPLLFGLVLYLIATIGCTFSPSVEVFIGMRLLTALGSCVGIVVGRAVVRDLFPVDEIAKVFSFLMLVMGIAPIIAPTIGGFAASALGWRYIFGLLIIISSLILLSVLFFLPESKGPDTSISLKPKAIFSEYVKVLKNPIFFIYTMVGALASAGMFAYISGSPFVFMKLFGLSESQYGILFGMNAMGFIGGSQLNRYALKYASIKKVIFISGFMQLIASFCLLVGTIFGFIGPIGTFAFIFSYMLCLGFLNPNTPALALTPFTKNAGSASAMLGSLQMVLGAIASALVSAFQNGTALPMVSVLFSCSVISCTLVLYSNFNKHT